MALSWRPRGAVALTSLYFANGYPEVPIHVACIVALYTVADRTHPLIAVACGSVAVAGAAWQEITSAMPPGDIVMITGWLLMVIAFGAASRSHRAYIADRLVLSHATVKTHVSRILGKLGARDRAQPVVVAYESGLVTPRWVRGDL